MIQEGYLEVVRILAHVDDEDRKRLNGSEVSGIQKQEAEDLVQSVL